MKVIYPDLKCPFSVSKHNQIVFDKVFAKGEAGSSLILQTFQFLFRCFAVVQPAGGKRFSFVVIFLIFPHKKPCVSIEVL